MPLYAAIALHSTNGVLAILDESDRVRGIIPNAAQKRNGSRIIRTRRKYPPPEKREVSSRAY